MLELPLNKVAGFQACIFIKERLQHRCFPVSIAKFLGTPILKACFHHDMDFGKYKDLVQRTESDKVLKDKAFEIASNPKCKKYEWGLASMVYKFFDKKSKRCVIKSMSNQQLVDELHKPIIRKFKRH